MQRPCAARMRSAARHTASHSKPGVCVVHALAGERGGVKQTCAANACTALVRRGPDTRWCSSCSKLYMRGCS